MSDGAIDIRPSTSVYATYQRLSYKPWFAIAEFLDNSTQSYFDHRGELRQVFKRRGESGLRVEISYDAELSTLTVYDNAYGMELEELTRALVLDSPPPNRSGRSEFGMGLKTAASWFGAIWSIETSQLGSSRRLTATIDVHDLAERRTESVPFEVSESEPEEHFTRLHISHVRHPVRGNTKRRVLDQLGSMYREDLRSGEIQIIYDGQPVVFQEPPILEETLEDRTKRVWRKDVQFEVQPPNGGGPLHVHGWIGLRDPGKQRDAGLVLLRRHRVIVGGPDEGYRPVEVFGQPNLYRSQRLVGELHMDDWPVTQAKDAFDWSDGLEEAFIEKLKKVCKDYGDYAEAYRSGRTKEAITKSQMEEISEDTRELISSEPFSKMVSGEIQLPDPTPAPEQEKKDSEKLREASEGPVEYALTVGMSTWVFRLHWQDQISDAHWMQLNYPQDSVIDIFLNMAHPFFSPYLDQRGMIELLQKLVVSLALAEHMARTTSINGHIMPEDFRNYMNKVLRRASDIRSGPDG